MGSPRSAFTLEQNDDPLQLIAGVRKASARHAANRNTLKHVIAQMRQSRVIRVKHVAKESPEHCVENRRMHLDLEYPIKPHAATRPKDFIDHCLNLQQSTFTVQGYLTGARGYADYFEHASPASPEGIDDYQRALSSHLLKLSLAKARADVANTQLHSRRLVKHLQQRSTNGEQTL